MATFKREDYQLESGKMIAHSFPGGYPVYYVTRDNGILCPDCAGLPESRQALPDCPDDRQWFIIGAECNWEDPALHCDHCGARIESAYADDSAADETEFGMMQTSLSLASTSLRLQEGQIVALLPATNLPTKGQFYARPHDGKWSDGLDHSPDDSILVSPEDVAVFPNLDCQTTEDLHTYCQDTRNPAPLREYAAIKARAQEARLAGRIQQALKWEQALDGLYKQLPRYLRNW